MTKIWSVQLTVCTRSGDMGRTTTRSFEENEKAARSHFEKCLEKDNLFGVLLLLNGQEFSASM